MKQVLMKNGSVYLKEVPNPEVEDGTVLIQLIRSCISIGTEMSGLKASAVPIWKKALKQPKNIKKLVNIAIKDGIGSAKRILDERRNLENPIGYSASGVVTKVGKDVAEFFVGDYVACAGAQCSFHAEVVRVPKNLVVSIPKLVSMDSASSVALGAIALQGVRRASPTLGEIFVVIGLGFLGQVTAQLLKINGCRVIGIDPDISRIEIAKAQGMYLTLNPEDINDISQISRLIGGIGADGVIITAASPSNQIMSVAFQICRKKARVVLVGDVGLELNRSDFYEKELDFLISTSYGPGRYDEKYEHDGLDYPLPYVRWTENRNMSEYLNLISEGKLNIDSMISKIYPFNEAGQAYDFIKSSSQKPLMALFSYIDKPVEIVKRIQFSPNIKKIKKGRKLIQIAVIGVGNFAKGMHLPNIIKKPSDFNLTAVVSRTSHNATAAGKFFGATYCATDYHEVLSDKNIDAVIIATRHNLHANIALDALKAGKHVLVEKPLALKEPDLQMIEEFFNDNAAKPILMTGFNRRFSSHVERIKIMIKNRSNPMVINYSMNAGYIPLNHWVHGPEGGGRNIGEACHIYDLFTFLIDAKVSRVQASTIKPINNYYSSKDNFSALINFDDGSLASLTYSALGNAEDSKEIMKIFVDGMVITLNDYRELYVVDKKGKSFVVKNNDKGQKEELSVFAKSIKGEMDWPIPLWQQLQSARISFEVDHFLMNKS